MSQSTLIDIDGLKKNGLYDVLMRNSVKIENEFINLLTNTKINEFVYIMIDPDAKQNDFWLKIGISNEPHTRSSKIKCKIICHWETIYNRKCEKLIRKLYKYNNVPHLLAPSPDGKTEWHHFINDDINNVIDIINLIINIVDKTNIFKKFDSLCNFAQIIKHDDEFVKSPSSVPSMSNIPKILNMYMDKICSLNGTIVSTIHNNKNNKNDKTNINTATKKELMNLPSIGDKRADDIIRYRTTKKFESIDEIKYVRSIADKTFNNIQVYITV